MADSLRWKIDELKDRVQHLGALVQGAVAKAIKALATKNEQLALQVVAEDAETDRQEVLVEEVCLRLLALYQPVAADLRFVVAALKINSDLERTGDLAKNIAKRVIYLARQPDAGISIDFGPMAQKASEMLARSLHAFVLPDVQLARQVCHDDDEVDTQRREFHKHIMAEINRHPEQTECLLKLYSVAKHIERLADMATTIAEEVITMVEGDIIRHRH
jgi:phosphate transport system protein